MGFHQKIKYFLVHSLKMTNAQAQELISSGRMELNGHTITENVILEPHWEIKIEGEIIRPAKEYVYIRFNKPRGYESSLNPQVKDSLWDFFKEFEGLSIAGRLDKDSEGLLILSDDGKWIENMINPKFEKEKEYEVLLDRNPDETFIRAFSEGVDIGFYFTRPCQCYLISPNRIRVILREGKNRQIRRMCKRLNYKVLELKRIRVETVELGHLKSGQWDFFKI